MVIGLLVLGSADAYGLSLNPISWVKGGFSAIKDAAFDVATTTAAAILGIDKIECAIPVVRSNPNCLFCPMFEILFNSSASVASLSYAFFKSDLGQLILIFLAVSLAFITLRNLASMGARDSGAIMNEFFSRAFVCAAIYVIITRDYYNILNMTIAPIIHDGLSFVGLTSSCPTSHHLSGMIGLMGAGGQTMPHEIGNMIVTSVCNIEKEINVLFDYGDWAWCRGMGPDRIFKVLPHPIYLIDGVLLYVGGLCFMIAYPWILADAVLQLGISLALLPFGVAGYAFNGTKKYLPKLFSWILHSLFVFIFMSILMQCLLGYVSKLLGVIFWSVGDYSIFFTDPNRGIAFFGPNMMKVIFILAIGWVYMPFMKDLAEKFAEGSGLSAGAKVGSLATNSIENAAGKVSNYAASAAGNAMMTTARLTGRRFNTGVRQGTMFLTNTFGRTNNNGDKTIKLLGTRFTVEKNNNGKSYLKRERTSGGRRYVMVSDKYTTINQVYDENGNLIKNEATFKHNFANKYLFNEDGQVNVGSLQALLDSRLGQDPQFRQAIMEQIAVNALKKKGYDIGTYYSKRNVVFDPNDPTKISIQQIDHQGQVTSFGIKVNTATGQTATSFNRDTTKTAPLHRTERKARTKLHKMFINNGGHLTNAGTMAFDTWLGTHYEMLTDPRTGEEYYIRERKKYWLFGPKEIKEFHANNTVRHVSNIGMSAAAQQAKIARKLGGANHKNTWLHSYSSFVNNAGDTVYTQNLRSFWNVKNYGRIAKGSLSFAGKALFKSTPQAAVRLATSALTTPFVPVIGAAFFSPLAAAGVAAAYVAAKPAKTAQAIRHPSRSLKDFGRSMSRRVRGIGNLYANDWQSSFENAIQTGNVKQYSASGKTVVDAVSGQTVSSKLNYYTEVKGINGEHVIIDNTTGEKKDLSKKRVHNKDFYFNNGVVEMHTYGALYDDGTTISETTKFKYSKDAQYGHDSILSNDDSQQIVDERGNISNRLQPTLANGNSNPLDLRYGLDDIAGVLTIDGMATQDFVIHNVLQEGRKRRTNKMSTSFLGKLNI